MNASLVAHETSCVHNGSFPLTIVHFTFYE